MSDFVHEKLLPVIRCGLGLEKPVLELTDRDYTELLRCASKHSIQVIVIQGLIRSELPAERIKSIKYEQYKYLKTFIQNIKAMEEIAESLNRIGVQFIPLKGAVIREYYPEESMRSSCDIDVLIHEKDLEKAVEALKADVFLEYKGRNYHDVLLTSDTVNLELHFSIKENMENIDRLLEDAWSYAGSEHDGCRCNFTHEYFMFHIISHMSYHMVNGGLGIRHFIDLWILRKNFSFDENELRRMLDQCAILKFYEKCCILADYWFNDGSLPSELITLEQYCIDGGVFGSEVTAAAAKQREHKGVSYVFRRIFIDRSVLQEEFPELREKPHLWLHCQFKRWLRVFDSDKRQSELARIKMASKTTQKEIRSFDELLRSLGL